jgi:hypothetical protein
MSVFSMYFFSEVLDNAMAIAILRVKEGLDCSHLVGSLSTEGLEKTLNSHGGSQNSLGYENHGLELDPSDVRTSSADGENTNGCPGTPQSLNKISLSNEKNDGHAAGLKFGKKKNKSADDLTRDGVYQ